jgi:hypothetical protein
VVEFGSGFRAQYSTRRPRRTKYPVYSQLAGNLGSETARPGPADLDDAIDAAVAMSLKALAVGGHVSLIDASLSSSGTGLDPLLLTGRGTTLRFDRPHLRPALSCATAARRRSAV